VDVVTDVIETVADNSEEATVWPIDTVYVPTPPVPVPKAVIAVYCATSVSVMTCPTAMVPTDTAVTVMVDPLMDAVNVAETAKFGGFGFATAGVPGH
jgi:hypothetical protein